MPSKKDKPALAIVTRTKNRNLLLERAIQSVQAQTRQDYIHVIVNDGGDRAVLNELLDRYPDPQRVVVHNDTSVGLVKALNQGVRAVDSRYIAILDDDDTWASERVEIVLGYFARHPEVQAVAVPIDIVIESIRNGKVVKERQYRHPESDDGEINLYKQCIRNYLSNGLLTYARTLYDVLGGYDETLATAEDWDFGIRLLLETDVQLLRTDEALAFYHQRPEDNSETTGNSVHAGVATQERTINLLRNRYLRKDIRAGHCGIGYIMNQAVVDQANTVRLEGHINYVGNKLDEHLSREAARLTQEIHQASLMMRILKKMKKNGR